jgi:hypothetical protein
VRGRRSTLTENEQAGEHSPARESRRTQIAISILIAIPSLLFLNVLLGKAGFYLRDIPFYYFPAKKLLREFVLSGHFPYWNPWFAAGQPMAANPEHEVFYPLTWLILLPDYFHGFQLLALVHIHIATLSMYALLRSIGLRRGAAIPGALTYGLGGYILSTVNLFPCLFGGAWIPLTCLFTRRFLRERNMRDFALAAGALGLELLAGEPVTVLQTGLLLGTYALFRGDARLKRILRDVALVGAISIGAVLVSFVQILPSLDHFRNSVRGRGFSFELVTNWSMPAIRLAELLYPSVTGTAFPETNEPYFAIDLYGDRGAPFYFSIYSGLLAACLAFAGIVCGTRGRWTFCALAILSIVLALGDQTPVFRILYDLGLRSFRFPEKFMALGAIATVVFASVVLDDLLRGNVRVRRTAAAFAASTAVLALAACAWTYLPDAPSRFRSLWRLETSDSMEMMLAFSRRGWIVAALRGTVLAAILAASARLRQRTAAALITLFVLADLATLAPRITPAVPREFFTTRPPVLDELRGNPGEFRIFPLQEWTPNARNRKGYAQRRPHAFLLSLNALSGETAVTWGYRRVMEIDYDLTALNETDDFVRAAWKIQEANPRNWINAIAAMANIEYVSTYRPFRDAVAQAKGDVRAIRPLRFVRGTPNPRYYFATEVVQTNTIPEFVQSVASERHSRQTAYVDGPSFQPAPGRVLAWRETPNTADIDTIAEGDSFLVMSVTHHKYWKIFVDGREVPAIRTNVGFQGVRLSRGRHEVSMKYRNPLVGVGAAVSIASILALIAAARLARPKA